MSYKIFYIMFINIFPPRRQWMNYRCRLVRKFIHCFGEKQPQGKIGMSYSLGLWDFIFLCPLYFFPCSCIYSYVLLFLCLISFLLFLCASVWENTRTWVPHLIHSYLMILPFSDTFNYKCTKENLVWPREWQFSDTSSSTSNPLPTKQNYE